MLIGWEKTFIALCLPSYIWIVFRVYLLYGATWMNAVQPPVMATPSTAHSLGAKATEDKGPVKLSYLQPSKWIQNCLFELDLKWLSHFYLGFVSLGLV